MIEYEEKHKEDLESAKGWLAIAKENDNKIAIQILEKFFPELKESEDEKIRKELIRDIDIAMPIETAQRYIAWLKKHGEQKLLNNDKYQTVSVKILDRLYESEKELERLKQSEQKQEEWHFPYGKNETVDKLIAIAECLEMDGDCLFNGYTGIECGKFLRDLARKQVECKSTNEVKLDRWSEEDEHCIELLLPIIDSSSLIPKNRKKCKEFLKSLKPNHWKPSEQNIKDLEWCADLVKDKMGVGFHRLQVFIDELKNLLYDTRIY